MKKMKLNSGLLAYTALLSSAVLGQEASIVLEEVLVTAQKRTESLQDVPISIVALSQEQLELRAIDELQDIALDIPNFTANSMPLSNTVVRLFIRGIGQNDAQLTQDPSVALYLDGVYIGTSVGAGFEGVDIERIEVLRGPQGTLYGRNATGGAVNIITRRANIDGLEFRQNLTGGNLGKFQSKTMLNLPITDTLAAKVNYNYSVRDGLVENDGSGEDFSSQDRNSTVLDLRWFAGEDLTLDYRFETAKIKDSEPFNQLLNDPADSSGILAGLVTYDGGYDPDRLDSITSQRNIPTPYFDIDAHTLWADWDINESLQLKSISAYRDLDGFGPVDVFPTAVVTTSGGGPFVGRINTHFEQWSQEFQLLGNSEHWEYVAGLYYYKDEATEDNIEAVILGVSGVPDHTETENQSFAAFSQATWNPEWMESRWRFTAGGRYSYDEREADRNNQTAIFPFEGSYDNDFSNFNPSFTVAFDINDDTNAYAKVVTGYKSGGTSTRSANAELFAEGFDEEDIFTTELGIKGEFWSGRGRYNSAVFYMEIDGLQTSVQTDPLNLGGRDFLPIDDTQIYGAELDLTLLLLEGLTFSFNYGYLDTELGEDVVVIGDVLTEELIGKMPYAPENSFFVALDYGQPLPLGTLGLNINYGWQDEVQSSVNVNGNLPIDSYGLLGAAVSWSGLELGDSLGRLRLLLWGRNLLDKEYAASAQSALKPFGADETAIFGEPRNYGLTVIYEY